jgi:RecJ-like exonuclease
MQEKNLLRLAILCSLIGIFILILISNNLEPKKLNINEITKEYIGQTIKTEGTITSIKITEELTVLEIKDTHRGDASGAQKTSSSSETGKIKVIAFEKINLKENNKVLIKGKIKEYKNRLEIEANEIKII